MAPRRLPGTASVASVLLLLVLIVAAGGVFLKLSGGSRLNDYVARWQGPPSFSPAPPMSTPQSTPTPYEIPTPDDAAGVLAAVQGHWDAIRDHRFTEAYGYLGPDLGMSETTWVTSHEQDDISNVRYDFNVVDVGFDSATVDVVTLLTTSRSARSSDNPTGCQSWTGSYGLTRQNGRWLIDQVHLTPAPC